MAYSFSGRVRYSEIGENGLLTLPGILNYFQDCSTFQSEESGLGIEVLKEWKRFWVLSAWQVIVERYPCLGENIRTSTWAYGFRSFLGMRNFCMETEDGERIAYANTYWTYINAENGLPVKLTERDTAGYEMEEKLDMDYAPRKIILPGEYEQQEAFAVQKHHLDTNYHMNNGQYVAVASDLLPENFEVNRLMVSYHKSAVLGDILYPVIYGKGTEEVTVVLETEEHSPYAIVKFNGILSKQENRVPVVGKIL